MNSELQPGQGATPPAKIAPRPSPLRALFAEWRKLSPSLAGPEGMSERELRLWYASRVLRPGRRESAVGSRESEDGKEENASGPTPHSRLPTPVLIKSWSQLTPGEIRRLARAMREESGDAAAWRARVIGAMAATLWGADWDAALAARLRDRWHRRRPDQLDAGEFRAEAEELMSRLSRQTGATMEELRRKFFHGASGRVE